MGTVLGSQLSDETAADEVYLTCGKSAEVSYHSG